MCQLLGMNSNQPADLRFSFAGFAERGGRTGEHKDGWGIAFHTRRGVRLFRDERASIASPLAEQMKQRRIKASNVVAHIRKATQGRVTQENCHPFTRTLWGRTWSFAHNGDLKGFYPDTGLYDVEGDTDSERAFCHLLSGLAERFSVQPNRRALYVAVAELAAEIAVYGTFNFLLSDGDTLFAHCSTHLHYVSRAYPFAQASLVDCEHSIDLSRHNGPDDRMVVIATQPLTSDETWHGFVPGELKMFADGHAIEVASLARQAHERHGAACACAA
ncbi:MAG: class II glutamine amidotransferase [Burkholderiaceae bacterium]|nr:class II glutamine amidotransferase [Burkholderiaceae bacterium]